MQMRIFLAFVCIFFVNPSSIVLAEDWTMFRGSNFGRTSGTEIGEQWDSKHVAWKTPLPGRGASCPVVFNDRVYLTAYSGFGIESEEPENEKDLQRHLICINSLDGKIVWEKRIPATSPKNPFTVWAVSLHGYASSTPAVDDTGIYVFFGATGLLAYSHEGKELWRANCGEGTHMFGAGSSPVLYQNTVIVNASVESGDLIALSKSDGSEVWRHSGVKESWNTPVIYNTSAGDVELAVAIKGEILGIDPANGEQLWTCKGIDGYICPSIIVQDEILYASGGRRSRMVAVRSGGKGDVTESHRVWSIDKGSNVSSPVYHDGHLYWAKEKMGIVYCADAKTGKILYEQRVDPKPGLIYASPLLANGRLYYISRENGTFVVDAKPKYTLLSHSQMEGDDSIFNASPVPHPAGGVLLRSDKYLYRIGPVE